MCFLYWHLFSLRLLWQTSPGEGLRLRWTSQHAFIRQHRASRGASGITWCIDHYVVHRTSRGSLNITLCIGHQVVHRASRGASGITLCIGHHMVHRSSRNTSHIRCRGKKRLHLYIKMQFYPKRQKYLLLFIDLYKNLHIVFVIHVTNSIKKSKC